MWTGVTILVRETGHSKDNLAVLKGTACIRLAKFGVIRPRYGSTHM